MRWVIMLSIVVGRKSYEDSILCRFISDELITLIGPRPLMSFRSRIGYRPLIGPWSLIGSRTLIFSDLWLVLDLWLALDLCSFRNLQEVLDLWLALLFRVVFPLIINRLFTLYSDLSCFPSTLFAQGTMLAVTKSLLGDRSKEEEKMEWKIHDDYHQEKPACVIMNLG